MAKVSDFGTSRTLSIVQTHVTTQVLGTFGYLDPEYYHSSQFTERSDVYSFGVVLIKLLTCKKPVFADEESNEVRNLATEFRSVMESSHLVDIVEPRVLKVAENKEIMTVAELARDCTNLNGKNRPVMKEVAVVLDALISRHRTYSKQQTLPEGDCIHVAARTCKVDAGPFISSTFSSYYSSSSSIIV